MQSGLLPVVPSPEMNRLNPVRFGLQIIYKGRTNHANRNNLTHNSDTGACGNNSNLAAQPVVGVYTRRCGRAGSDYTYYYAYIRPNLINS